ncbi:NAD(P)H-binding protein [Cryptosporangium phraense]|uniref:NAD-dependent epimerase/dehydratase family protein n=1 Tax=Cryptosporangium phraense TaxID=2593070 RepID=A0A545AE57_9ACTN|nr:NAD(P)H-binding protein [Cryptosporangium phraense]TQS39626.1 NAD-dependent epimerase/dehydratase family protein [Cryptosporangium phraense]
MRILVLGASGNVGSEVVAAGLEAGLQVRAVARHLPADAGGAEWVIGDLNDAASLYDALSDVDLVFTLAGYGGLADTLRRAKETGVRRVVLLSSSSAPTGRTGNAVAKYHIESEGLVRESGLPWTFLQPNTFMTNTLEWAPQLAEGDTVTDAFGAVAISTVDPRDVGAVAIRTATDEAHAGRAHRLSGPEALRPADRLAILGAVLGRDLRFVPKSDEQAHADMIAAMPPEYVEAFFEFFADGLIDETTVQPAVEEILGRPAAPFRDWAERHRQAFS